MNGRITRPLVSAGLMFILLAPNQAIAQDAAASPKCWSEHHRQFDFWIGEWTVTDPEGNAIGANTIQRSSAGCALLEHWRGRGGGSGTSINFFDAETGQWHQLWVGGTGLILRLQGHYSDGRMVLTSAHERMTPGGRVLDRITWTPRQDGSVEQLWLISADDGATWREYFRGIYRKPED